MRREARMGNERGMKRKQWKEINKRGKKGYNDGK